MSSEFLRKAANVMEKFAALLEEQEVTQQRGVAAEQEKTAAALSEKLASALGEEISTADIERLDPSSLKTLQKIAARLPQNEAPENMGDVDDDGAHQDKTASTDADKAFVDWVMS
jgi:flagellar motor switch protein FliG